MTRRTYKKKHNREKSSDKKRKTSLFRKLSSRKAEQQRHLPGSPLTPSRSFSSLNRSLSSGDSLPGSPTHTTKSPKSPPLGRIWSPASDSSHSTADSSQSSSPSSSTPNSPAANASNTAHYTSRPSSLHGLKHKLQTIKSPHRRKSVHNIPLSPLARTPSPSPMATSPTRSPSPLTMVHGHHVGSSHMTQTYPAYLNTSPSQTLTTPAKKTITRPKSSCDPGSPLLRRALSPDRLHPQSAEKQKVSRKASWQEPQVTKVERPEARRKSSWHEKRELFDKM